MSDEKLHRAADSQTVGTADRLAVGVSPLTRPDSFHAGSCDSEREDWVRFRMFDVGVALAFEGTARFASVCFFKPCCVRLPKLPRRWGGWTLPVTHSDSQKQTT